MAPVENRFMMARGRLHLVERDRARRAAGRKLEEAAQAWPALARLVVDALVYSLKMS